MSSPRPCQAKIVSACPYHGNIYRTADHQTLAKRTGSLLTDIDKLEASAENIDIEVSASAAMDLQRAKAELIIVSALLDATPEMKSNIKKKALREQQDNEISGDTDAKWKNKFLQAYRLDAIRKTSEARFNEARADIDATMFVNRTTKLKALAQAFSDEQKNLDADCAKDKWVAPNSQTDSIDTTYYAVKYELNKFAQKISWTTHESGSPSSAQDNFLRIG